MNVVDVNSVAQQESNRQSKLTAEQRRNEEKEKEQAEKDATISDDKLLQEDPNQPTEFKPSEGDNNHVTEPDNQGNENNSGGQSEGSEPVDTPVTEPPAEPSTPDVQPTQPGGIPGEVLKPEVSEPAPTEDTI